MAIEYAAVVITPDSIRDGLADLILGDLESEAQAQVVFKKKWTVTSVEGVLSMYPRLLGKPSYAPVMRTMMSGECLVVILRGENLFARLPSIKGKMMFNVEYTDVEVTGLRFKYRNWDQEDLLRLKNPSTQPAALAKIFDYRLHTTDSVKEAANMCLLCMNDADLATLRDVAPSLHAEAMRIAEES